MSRSPKDGRNSIGLTLPRISGVHGLDRSPQKQWQYLYQVALRIALVQQEPYVSLRTLWQEASARGFGVADMLGLLAGGDIAHLPEIPFIRPK